ncbi:nuclear transport factor 2 family protein [Nocardia sp. 348MFTsu5.1]|uniref:nuclear transport factor 2 family protein n=1 Tax=Nocardia sp. 348MFTsu5.1 TaxID=1172185 RepID=UPI00036542E1|nr:nuclear transport factor 2 family protein [Nocardia sp. 348MFTsu5.1]
MSSKINSCVVRYLEAIASRDSAEIAALYAADATVEDPAGGPVRTGIGEIEDFYKALESVDGIKAELITVRSTQDTAVFHFTVTTTFGGQQTVIDPIDVMTFDSDLKITSMKAYWSEENVVQVD